MLLCLLSNGFLKTIKICLEILNEELGIKLGMNLHLPISSSFLILYLLIFRGDLLCRQQQQAAVWICTAIRVKN